MLVWSFKLTTCFQTENVSGADRSKSVTQEIPQCELWQQRMSNFFSLAFLSLRKDPFLKGQTCFQKHTLALKLDNTACHKKALAAAQFHLQHTPEGPILLVFFYSPWTSQHSNRVSFSQAFINCLRTNMGRCVHTCMYEQTNQPTNQQANTVYLYLASNLLSILF